MYEKRANEVVGLFEKLSFYPYALDEEGKEKIRKKIVRMYKKGDDTVKGMIVFYVNEKLSNIEKFRQTLNMDKAKGMKAKDPRTFVVKEMLNYFNSLDGQFFLLDLLKDFDDELALRLLHHYLTRYLSLPGKSFQLLAQRAICNLGESNNPFALELLLSLRGVEDEALYVALDKWRRKIDRLRIDEGKKKKLKELFANEEGKHFFS